MIHPCFNECWIENDNKAKAAPFVIVIASVEVAVEVEVAEIPEISEIEIPETQQNNGKSKIPNRKSKIENGEIKVARHSTALVGRRHRCCLPALAGFARPKSASPDGFRNMLGIWRKLNCQCKFFYDTSLLQADPKKGLYSEVQSLPQRHRKFLSAMLWVDKTFWPLVSIYRRTSA